MSSATWAVAIRSAMIREYRHDGRSSLARPLNQEVPSLDGHVLALGEQLIER
jgi:hypothetical protein